MTDITEKIRFRTVQFGKRFGALAFLLMRKRIANARQNMIGDEIEEPAVRIVECAPRRNPKYDDAIYMLLPGRARGMTIAECVGSG